VSRFIHYKNSQDVEPLSTIVYSTKSDYTIARLNTKKNKTCSLSNKKNLPVDEISYEEIPTIPPEPRNGCETLPSLTICQNVLKTTRSTAVAEAARCSVHVVKNFAKSLKIVQYHWKWHHSIDLI